MTTARRLDQDAIVPLFFKYYVPALTSLLASTVHQVINALILAHQIGKAGVTAVGLFGPVLTVFIAFALALMIGSGILVGRSIGAKDYGKAQEVFQFSTTLALTFGLAIACCSPWLARFFTDFLVGPGNDAVAQTTYTYMLCSFIWTPLLFIRMLWGNLISNDDGPKTSRNASLLAVALNIALDFLLVIVLPWGVAGASIATGLSMLFSFVYLVFHIKKGNGNFGFRDFRFTWRFKEWRKLIQYGVPSFISELSFSLGLLVINKRLIPFGTNAVAAFGIVNHLSFFFLRLFTAAMIAALPILSHNIGAQLPGRVLHTLRFSMLFTFLLGIAVWAIVLMNCDFLLSLFSGDDTVLFHHLSRNALLLYFILFVAAGPNYILGAYFQAIGKSFLASLLHVLKGIALVGLLVFLLPGHLGMGINGIWLSRVLAEVFTLLGTGIVTLCFRQYYYSPAAILAKKTITR